MTTAPLQKLLTWLSPAFPVGTFAWSAGLETAIADGRVTTAAALQDWIAGSLAHGGARTDAILLAHAHRAIGGSVQPLHPYPMTGEELGDDRGMIEQDPPDTSALAGEASQLVAKPRNGARSGHELISELAGLADLALALTASAERQREATLTGDAFVTAARAWPSDIYAQLPNPCPYPIAVGAIAGAHDIALADTLLGYLTMAVHSQISVAVRLVPLGQTDGLRVMAALESAIAALAAGAATATLDDIGGIAYAADIAQMRHETLEPRIFRS